jgi:hypothetical protein
MKRLVLLAVALSCGWVLACGGGAVPEQPPSAIDDFATRYGEATCDAMPDCCKAAGFAFDTDPCKDAAASHMSQSLYLALATLKVHFDQAAAEHCLMVRVDLYRSCMGDGAAEVAACNAVLVGEVPVGSSCASTLECTAVPGMVVSCVPDAANSTKSRCTAAPPVPVPPVGKSGDVCSTTCPSAPTAGCTSVAGAPSASACLVTDGLICDGASRACSAVPQIGEACAQFCASGAYCDASSQCSAQVALGAPCSTDAECSSSYCAQGSCHTKTPVSAALCDGAT